MREVLTVLAQTEKYWLTRLDSPPRPVLRQNGIQRPRLVFTLTLNHPGCVRFDLSGNGNVMERTFQTGDLHAWNSPQGAWATFEQPMHLLALEVAPEQVGAAEATALFDKAITNLRDPVGEMLLRSLADDVQLLPTSEFEAAACHLVQRFIRLYAQEGLPDKSPRSTARRFRPEELTAVLRYIEAHLHTNLTIKQLAEYVGYAPTYFAAMFRESLGISPHRYLLQKRLEQAQHLLDAGASPSEASSATGFFDQSHLTRQLRKHTGRTTDFQVGHIHDDMP